MNWRSKQTYHDLVKLGISRLLNLKRVCFVNYYTNLGQWENVACTELRPFVCLAYISADPIYYETETRNECDHHCRTWQRKKIKNYT